MILLLFANSWYIGVISMGGGGGSIRQGVFITTVPSLNLVYNLRCLEMRERKKGQGAPSLFIIPSPSVPSCPLSIIF